MADVLVFRIPQIRETARNDEEAEAYCYENGASKVSDKHDVCEANTSARRARTFLFRFSLIRNDRRAKFELSYRVTSANRAISSSANEFRKQNAKNSGFLKSSLLEIIKFI